MFAADGETALQLPRALEVESINGDLAATQPWMARIPGLLYRVRQLERGSVFLIYQTGS
jgi:hypothetical protein